MASTGKINSKKSGRGGGKKKKRGKEKVRGMVERRGRKNRGTDWAKWFVKSEKKR